MWGGELGCRRCSSPPDPRPVHSGDRLWTFTSLSIMSSHTVYIDDADKSKIHYRTIELGPYRGRGFQPLDNQGDGVYDGTLSVTDVEDVSAVVTFTGVPITPTLFSFSRG